MVKEENEISNWTGLQLQEKLIGEDFEWKHGRIIVFQFKIRKALLNYFQIKAVAEIKPVNEILFFTVEGGEPMPAMSWENSRAILRKEGFSEFYENFLTQNLSFFSNDVLENSEFMQLCIVLTVEVARRFKHKKGWIPFSLKEILEAIRQALRQGTDEDLASLDQMFTQEKLANCKTAFLTIFKRENLIKDIAQCWWVNEIGNDTIENFLSEDKNERKASFQRLKQSLRQFEDKLQNKDVAFLIHLKKCITTKDVDEAEKAFESLDLAIRAKKEEE